MPKVTKKKQQKAAHKKKTSKKSTATKTSESVASVYGYKVVAKPSKPDFSEDMIKKMVAASKF